MPNILRFGGGVSSGGGSNTILVNVDTGAIVTATDADGKLYTATSIDGVATIKVAKPGIYTITATKDGEEAGPIHVEVTDEFVTELKFNEIYGISRDITVSSPEWTRTDDAVGFTATASVGTVAGSSSFDNIMPWAGIVRETLDTGDVMVKIPKFYYRRYRDGNIEHIQISGGQVAGFKLHPLFNHGGVESEYAYIGAYEISSGAKSVTGVAPWSNATRAAMRNTAKSKGSGWGIIDIAAVSAIQMLCLVEFATNDVQTAIGEGHVNATGITTYANTGSCDTVPNLTGVPTPVIGVVWRGIENFWGNCWEYVDGVNFNDGKYYVCNDQSKYADNTTTDYEELSFTGATNWSSSYITEEGLDTGNNPHIMFASAAGSGSGTTYLCDGAFSASGWTTCLHGGWYSGGTLCGLFAQHLSYTSTATRKDVSSRLMYIPQ